MDPFGSAVDIAAAIRNRGLSPVEVIDVYLRRLDQYDPVVNAFVWRNDDAVRECARAAEQAVLDDRELSPFHGVPIPVKDLTQVAGQPATYGVHETPRDRTEPVVTRLLDAGFLLMGRTNTPDMGLLSTTDNTRFGSTRNPWNPAYSPGGSSGGAAAAVAAGLAPVAHANDGGGSIRMPSSCCGLVGLKPSRGRVPQQVASWEHATVEGAITRSTRDAAALLDALSAPHDLVMYRAPAPERPFADEPGRDCGPLRIGVLLDAPTGMPVDPICTAAAEHTADLLESLGHEVFAALQQGGVRGICQDDPGRGHLGRAPTTSPSWPSRICGTGWSAPRPGTRARTPRRPPYCRRRHGPSAPSGAKGWTAGPSAVLLDSPTDPGRRRHPPKAQPHLRS